ncbi:cation:proton antiporter [Spirochaetia bacterium 38H-sp]|uniref:Cation:proton antiporter n=1 Tax=Rarispira pelagica TaxID=3141764 RepID=A0ABU9U8Z4_9SPIR
MEFLNEVFSKIAEGHLNILLLLGLVLFGGTIGAKYFKKIKMPQVIAYLVLGIIVGESGFKILSSDFLVSFEPFNYFALGLISFALGGELDLGILKKHGKVLSWVLFLEAFGAFIFVGTGFFFLSSFVFGFNTALVIALLAGSISAATAAAGTTDVLWEYRAKGTMTTTLLGVIALDDVLALLLFAISSSAAFAILGLSANTLENIIKPVYEIGGASLLGWGAARVLSGQLKNYTEEERIFVFTMGMVILVLGISLILEVDMLMAATVMGFSLKNYAPRKTTVILKLLEKFAGPIYLLFFVFVGAKLTLSSMTPLMFLFIAAFLALRMGGKWVGTALGAKISGAPSKIGRYLPLCLFSQSGVAIGLSLIAAQRFPGEIGQTILVVVTTTVFIVQLIGPAFTKVAIEKAGEAGLNITEEDILAGSRVSDLVRPRPEVIYNDMPLSAILKVYAESDQNFWLVVDKEGKYRGVIGFENLRNALAEPELQNFILAEDILTPLSQHIEPELSLADAARKLRQANLDAIPILDKEGRALGVLEEREINQYVHKKLLEAQSKAEA